MKLDVTRHYISLEWFIQSTISKNLALSFVDNVVNPDQSYIYTKINNPYVKYKNESKEK